MKKHNSLLYIILICIASSCNINNNNGELSGGYFYSDSRYIRSHNGFLQPIYPVVVDYIYDDSFILIAQKPSREDHVELLAFDICSNFRILNETIISDSGLRAENYKCSNSQFIKDDTLYHLLSANISLKNTARDIQVCKQYADMIIKNTNLYQVIFSREINYWIISHKKDNKHEYDNLHSSRIYGPFSTEEYQQKRKELGVPEQLKLKFEK